MGLAFLLTQLFVCPVYAQDWFLPRTEQLLPVRHGDPEECASLLQTMVPDASIQVVGSGLREPYPAELSEGGRQLISRCRGSHGDFFRTAQELLLAVNPESSLTRLDPRSAARCIRLGTEAFLNGQSEAGMQAWREAVKHDWLDAAPRNNIAVVKMKNSQWEEALEHLHEAYKIFSYHPVVDLNIGCCQWKLGDLEAADFWLNRSADLNPWFAGPRLILAQVALAQGHDQVAMRQIRNFCAMMPRSKRGRLTLSAILDRTGDTREAERQRNLASSAEGCSSSAWNGRPEAVTWGSVNMLSNLLHNIHLKTHVVRETPLE